MLKDPGGNDVELTKILNQCIFQWFAINEGEKLAAKAAILADDITPGQEIPAFIRDADWDAAARGCEGQLAYSESLIEEKTFRENLDAVLQAAIGKLGTK